jgi:hypothetical protein
MKTSTLLLTVAFGIILFSCNTNTGQKKLDTRTENQTADNKSIAIEDSIKKANELVRQDSIDAAQIKGYSVKKLSGKHKYGGVTKVEYQSLTDLIAEAKKESQKEMWTKEKLQSRVDAYKSACIGGKIRLDIERTTIGSANTEMFSIIIKDINENELYRVNLDSSIPNYSSENWWNIGFCYIDIRIKAPFYVYVVDKLEDAPFKFEVTPIKK